MAVMSVNNHLAKVIRDGFFSAETSIAVDLESLNYVTVVVKAFRHHVTPHNTKALSLHCAMLVSAEAWPNDRTTYSMQAIHLNQKGQPFRWLEFTLKGEEGRRGKIGMEGFFVSEPPTYHGDWTPVPPTQVEVKVIGDEMACFNLTECPEGHDGTPQALVVMGTINRSVCHLGVDTAVLPTNRSAKKTLNMDQVIARSAESEKNPGWGGF